MIDVADYDNHLQRGESVWLSVVTAGPLRVRVGAALFDYLDVARGPIEPVPVDRIALSGIVATIDYSLSDYGWEADVWPLRLESSDD